MNCTHCGHTHIDPATGEIDIDRCFTTVAGVQCDCRDFDH
jgi:hypothetical protein